MVYVTFPTIPPPPGGLPLHSEWNPDSWRWLTELCVTCPVVCFLAFSPWPCTQPHCSILAPWTCQVHSCFLGLFVLLIPSAQNALPVFFFLLNWVFIRACGLSCPMTCRILGPQPGTEYVYPALEGKFLTTGPPGKSLFFLSSCAWLFRILILF